MTASLTLGIDVGTTAVKVAAFDPQRGVIAEASNRNTLYTPHQGWAEADPAAWWEAVRAGIGEVAGQVGAERVAAIAVSGMVPALVCADERGRPVRRAILQNDARAADEVVEISRLVDPDGVLRATGSPITQQSIAPTALWVARHEPDAWQRTATVMGSYDWIMMMLGAPAHIELNWAIESGLFDLAGERYRPVLQWVDGLTERLPMVRRGGSIVGTLRDEVAREVGLATDVVLVVGGADHVLSAYGAGLTQPGEWLVKIGGAGDILAVTDQPIVDARFYLDAHPNVGRWLPNGCMATSGSLVRWVQSVLSIDDLASMDDEAEQRPAASLLCLPYFLGEKSPLNDPDLRGVFAGLHLGHTRTDLYRAALEGIAFGFRHNAEALRAAGVELGIATITNGGATSLLWKTIHASVLGVPLRTVRGHPGASLGAAMLAATAVDPGGAPPPEALVAWGPTIDPRPALVARYDDVYPIWRELGAASAASMRALARS